DEGHRRVYSADGRFVLGAPPRPIHAFFSDRPLAVGLDGGVLCMFSTNSYREIAVRQTAGDLYARNRRNGIEREGFGVFPDGRRNRVIVVHEDMVNVVPLSALNIKAEPMLGIHPVVPDSLRPGQAVRVPLNPTDPGIEMRLQP